MQVRSCCSTVPAARIESTASVVLVSRTRTRTPWAFEYEYEYEIRGRDTRTTEAVLSLRAAGTVEQQERTCTPMVLRWP
ncbi:MAG: hypothetical protein HZA54_17625, partial [Planctomycetes bacterium]|nr:hypothetical protein [Planctomycetota bacterium]